MNVVYKQVFLHICMRVAIGMSTTSPELLGVRACPQVSDAAIACMRGSERECACMRARESVRA